MPAAKINLTAALTEIWNLAATDRPAANALADNLAYKIVGKRCGRGLTPRPGYRHYELDAVQSIRRYVYSVRSRVTLDQILAELAQAEAPRPAASMEEVYARLGL